MKIQGTITHEGRWWVVDVPSLEASTQGRTKTAALAMAVAWVRDMVDDQAADVQATSPGGDRLILAGSPKVLVPLLLRQRRLASGLSVREAAQRLGSDSPNAYARYEQGKSLPTLDQLDRLLQAVAVDDGAELVIH